MAEWYKRKTKHNYPADEVISALQKDIRRNNEERALFWAYEIIISGDEFAEKFWERVTTIAVEDIGFANPMACVVIQSLKQSFYAKYDKPADGLLQALFATAYLARSQKDRYVDEVKHYIEDQIENNGVRPPIPDYALDKHTSRGKDMHRGFTHFVQEGARLSPEKKNRNKKYLKYMQKMLSD